MKLPLILVLAAVAATAGCGYSSKPTTPPSAGTMPVISQLVPNNVIAGSSTFTLEVDGSKFGGQAVVNFNGAAMSTTFVSSTKLTASIPASAITASGTVPVTVTNPGTPGGLYGGGTQAATSAAVDFTIN
jgi:hypothetical protein